MKSHIRLFLIVSAFVALPLFAQQSPNNALGFQPDKSFQMGDFDTVNLFNGNLTAAIPIGPSFTPGGNLTYGLHLIYNGNAWVMQGDDSPEAIPNRFSNAGLGWRMSLGELVAPHDPFVLDISVGGNWLYIGADGSEHTFYTTLHDEEDGTAYAGSGSTIPTTVVAYTRDGSYLRLRRGTRTTDFVHHPCPIGPNLCNTYTVLYSIEAPDGNVHTFEAHVEKVVTQPPQPPTVAEDEKLNYRLTSIVDRFGNYLHVTYPDPLTWVLKDGTTAGDIRTHTIHFLNQTFYEYAGTPNAHLFIEYVDLAAFNGQTARYRFNYSDYVEISKNCDDQYSGATTKTRFLYSVTQPDGSAFAMDYNRIEHDPSNNPICSRAAGHLLKLTLPTGGSVRYTLELRTFPRYPDDIDKGVAAAHSARTHSTAVATRTLFDANNASAGTWTYHADLTNPVIYYHQPNNTATTVEQGLIVTVTDPLQRTSAWYFDVDHFGIDPICYPGGEQESQYAMPFTHMANTAATDGLLLSSEVYDGLCTMQFPGLGMGCTRSCVDGSGQVVSRLRSTYVQYEQFNGGISPGDQERRLKKSRTVFDTDTGCGGAPCYEETDFDDFDGLGHYRQQIHKSNFPGTTDQRVTTTHYNARGGTYVPGNSNPDTYMIPVGSLWLPNVYDFQTTTEGSQTARTELCFNATTAFLERRRTVRSSGDRTKDLLATFEQTNGNVTAESYFGGDTQPLAGGFGTCTSTPGTSTYRLTHHYSYGSVDSTQYDGVGFKSLDLTIDQNTGLAKLSRDTTGLLETRYSYDSMQRLSEVHPPDDAWTAYTYALNTHSSLSILRRPSGTSTSATPETSKYLYFDSFGRAILSKEQFPEGWATTKTAYDALGRVINTWMPEFRTTSSWEDFTPAHDSTSTTYDRFDRPLSITMPDGKGTTFSYTGSRVTSRTTCVSASVTQSPCQDGERPFTTTETVDGHGRLYTVTEPLGTGITTTYGYDVGNRLASVSTDAPEGVQQRFFHYDLAGLLTSEQHPEKGADGNGTVAYPEYDARGHLRHRIDGLTGGQFDTKLVYDAAERLTSVTDLDPTTSSPRDLKIFTFNTVNPGLGKLDTATRHNYQPSLGGDIPVTETYTYGGLNGRVSARVTTVGGAFPTNTFTLGQTWDDLGNLSSLTYPTNAALPSTPARTVGYTFTNALLTGVTGYTNSMTYLPNGVVGHIGHINGQNEDWTQDPNGMPRPSLIHITGNGVDKSIGHYSYDAAGNIKQIGDNTGTYTGYQYDGAGRLTTSTAYTSPSVSATQTFSYDSFGNKLGAEPVHTHQFDPNGDNVVDVADIFYLVNYLFMSGPIPRGAAGMLSGDANEDGVVSIGDIFFFVNYLFLSGPAPNIPTQAFPSGDDMKPDKTVVDSVTVGTVTASGNQVDVPVYLRDLAGTLLGHDQASGSKLQSFAIKVAYSPASAVSSVTFTRAGNAAALAPSAEFHASSTASISLVDTFQESTSPLPFSINAAPGDLVAHLVFTLSDSATPGSTITLSLDPSVTLLANDGGTAKESPAGGTLALVDGAINIPVSMQALPPSNAAAEGVTNATPAPIAKTPTAAVSGLSTQKSPRPAIYMQDTKILSKNSILRSPMVDSYTSTTNHDDAFTYDDAGDVISNGTGSSFTYDALSMMTGATVPRSTSGTRTFAYVYTTDDERIALVEKLSSGATTTTWTLRGLDNHLLRTWFSSSTSAWSWREDDIWRGGSLLAYVSATGVRHYGIDHLGSPVVVTDSLGHPIGNISYDAFGNGGVTGAGMIAYTGQERDASNVLTPWTGALPDYFHARYYDTSRGRFLSVDPELNLEAAQHTPQKWNRYAYVLNDPILYRDPTGKQEAAGFAMDRDVQDLMSHRITEKEYWARLNARGVGALIGAVPWAGWWGVSTMMSWLGVGTVSSAAGSSVLLGETMRRIQPIADEMNAGTFNEAWSGDKAQMMARNITWLQGRIDGGARVFDLGRDALKQVPSDFYASETKLLQTNGYVQQFVKYVMVNGEMQQLFEWVKKPPAQ